jgi:hypothetical protein
VRGQLGKAGGWGSMKFLALPELQTDEANDDRASADDKDGGNVGPFGHRVPGLAARSLS